MIINKHKYDKKITVRLTSLEDAELNQWTRLAGKSLSRFLVGSGLGKKHKLVAGRGHIEKDVLEKLSYEIRKIGININQIAHNLNVRQLQDGNLERGQIEKTAIEVEKTMQKVRELF